MRAWRQQSCDERGQNISFENPRNDIAKIEDDAHWRDEVDTRRRGERILFWRIRVVMLRRSTVKKEMMGPLMGEYKGSEEFCDERRPNISFENWRNNIARMEEDAHRRETDWALLFQKSKNQLESV